MRVIAAIKHALGPCALTLAIGTFSLPAAAFVEDITAVFRPDPTNPMSNKFKNTTPESGVCAWHAPAVAKCKALNIFGIRNTGFSAASISPIYGEHEDPRQGAYFKVPSSWRDVSVTHVESGKTETLQMRIAGVGTRWHVPYPPGVSAFGRAGYQWGEPWGQGVAPCQGIG